MEKLGKIFVDVTRYHRYMTHNALSKLGLGRGMPPVLEYIIHNDGCRQSDISREGHMTPATATVMLQSMEKNGYISRKGDENDQRCIRLYITDEGRRVAELGKEAVESFDDEFFGILSEEDRETLGALLMKLHDAIDEKIEKSKNSGKEKQV